MLLSHPVKIEKHIAQLLRNYDCVIIPGLGGFVANYSPSQFNMAKGLLSPPSKAIIFNRNLINNDGLLMNHLSVNENLSYTEASNFVNEFVVICKNQLATGKRIEFDELGVLYEDSEKTLQFRPDFSVNFLTESFGLFPVVAKELVQSVQNIEAKVEVPTIKLAEEKISYAKATEIKEEKITREIKPELRTVESQNPSEKKIVSIKRKRRTGTYIAAAVIGIPLIFYSVWIPLKTDVIKTGVIQVADLNPFHAPVAPSVYKPFDKNSAEDLSEKIMPTAEESELEEPVLPIINEVDTTLVDANNHIEENIDLNNNYHIIAGCFQEGENAQRMVEYLQNKGYKAYILDTVNGLQRVSAASYSNPGDAMSALRDIRGNQVSEAWLLSLK
jgi:cell division septation protein DedD